MKNKKYHTVGTIPEHAKRKKGGKTNKVNKYLNLDRL
jgi:hypothetical protein